MEETIVNQSIIDEKVKTLKNWAINNLLGNYIARKFDMGNDEAPYSPCVVYYNVLEVNSTKYNAFIVANTIYKLWNNDLRKYDYNVIYKQTVPLTSDSFGDIIDARTYNRELRKWKSAEMNKTETLYNKIYNCKKTI